MTHPTDSSPHGGKPGARRSGARAPGRHGNPPPALFRAEPQDNNRLANLCGPLDINLRQIEERLNVKISRRDASFHIDGSATAQRRALAVLDRLHRKAQAVIASEEIELLIIEVIDADRSAESQARQAAVRAQTRPAASTAAPGQHRDHGQNLADNFAQAFADTVTEDLAEDTAEDLTDDFAVGLADDIGRHDTPAPSQASTLASTQQPTQAPPREPTREPTQEATQEPMQAHAHEQAVDDRQQSVEGPGHDLTTSDPEHEPDNPTLDLRKVQIQGRTEHQRDYLRKVLAHDITFGIGPAGTGKTYLAVACATAALERDEVARIVLTRPAVEAGERLGYLPGDLAQKVDPYLRPLYDALYDLMGYDKVTRLFERQSIEIAPLAYMRGRTLNRSFIILDEAQNTTPEQMKMFLTRIGFGSKAVVTGDVTQIDLPKNQQSGLVQAQHILANVRGIAFTRFTSRDVVRHPLVGRIVDAYERHAGSSQRSADER